MFKFMHKMSPNFVGGKSSRVKGAARRKYENLGSGCTVSFAATRMMFGWVLTILLCPFFASAQVSELWVARYHGSADGSTDRAVAMALDSAGNVYVTGQSQGTGTGIDYATVAYDPKGNQLWAARYNGPANGDDLVNGIAVDSKTGHVYVTGQSQGTGTGSDYVTVAYDFEGNQLWVARYSGLVGGIFDASIAVDSKIGNVYVTGGPTTTAYDFNGNQLWVATDQPDDFHHWFVSFNAIAVDSQSGTVYVTGYISGWGGYYMYFRTVAYDQTGTQLWADHRPFGGRDNAQAVSIASGSTGNIYVTGYLFDDTVGGSSYATVGYGPQGFSAQYQTVFGGYSVASAIAVDSNTGNVYVTGNSGTVAYGSGNRLWVAEYTAGLDAKGIVVDAITGNVYVTGKSGSDYATVAYDSGGNQLWAARRTGFVTAIAVDGNTGNVIVTGRESQASGNGTDFTTIAYSQDTTPPVTAASASPGPNSNGWNNTNVIVTLNSTDSGRGATGVKQIQYALTGAQSLDTQTTPGSTTSAAITAEGMTTLNYFGTDNVGNAEQSKALTVQIDKTPPVVSGMPASSCVLWPPNGRMVEVATVAAADALSGVAPGSFQLTGSSNEPSDPTKPDVVLTPNGSGGYAVQLRSARLGSGTGRIYTLNATATDLAGNTVTSMATCSVPRDYSTAKAH